MHEKYKRFPFMLDVLAHIKESGLHTNPDIVREFLYAQAQSDPRQSIERIESYIAVSKMFRKSPFSLPDENVDGPLRFALTEKNQPIGLYPEECHVLIAGQTGSGKSTLIKIIFTQALMQECNAIWMFVKSQEMRPLLAVEQDIIVTDFKNIKINIFEPPPGIPVMDWTSIIADILIQAFRLYDGSKNYIIHCL